MGAPPRGMQGMPSMPPMGGGQGIPPAQQQAGMQAGGMPQLNSAGSMAGGMPQGMQQSQGVQIPQQGLQVPGNSMFPSTGSGAVPLGGGGQPQGMPLGAPQGMPPANALPQMPGAHNMGGGGGPNTGIAGSPILQANRQQEMQQMQNAPGPEPAVAEALQKMMSDPKVNGMCGAQIQGNTTGVGEECWKKIWAYVGCPTLAPPYMTWHNSQSYEILLADAVQWAQMPSEKHRLTCYGKTEL